METILGIDLGTTNSVVSIIRDGQPFVIRDRDGQAILPSAVGVDGEGRLLVGAAARNQALLAPERTILSVKRRMGEDVRLPLGEQKLTPQEVSAIILRTLKQRAEEYLDRPVLKAVITVPAFFSENQRTATREAGELAGLEVVRIINEPTAASLTYQPGGDKRETLLVYDLGGGTFDVSIVQIEQGVVEVLASHGDTHLGGDDFDKLLLDHVCQRFEEEQQGIDLRQIPTARSRLLQAVEQAKCRLSSDVCATIQEPFLAEKKGTPINLEMTIERSEYEELIAPLIDKTIHSVDAALADAKMAARDIDKVILVGGSSRTPMVHRLLMEQLSHEPHLEVDPDLCVSLGAAMQGGMIAGEDVGPVLVDITPRTLGIRVVGELHGMMSDRRFSPLIRRNTPLPATRSELYYTMYPGQDAANIEVYQGENEDVGFNEPVGSFCLEGLDEDSDERSEILVRFELDLDGTLNVTAVERATALEKQLRIDNAVARFRAGSHEEAKARLSALLGPDSAAGDVAVLDETAEEDAQARQSRELLAKADRLLESASPEDAEEIRMLIARLEAALDEGSQQAIDGASAELEDVLFYVEDV